jgi:hypothetical protein
MAKIRRGTITSSGPAAVSVKDFEWNDSHDTDRRRVDDEMVGKVVQMGKSGSGSFTLLAGTFSSGYATSTLVFTWSEVAVASGVETVTTKTATFTEVYFNTGGSVDNDAGPGERKINFDYGLCTLA